MTVRVCYEFGTVEIALTALGKLLKWGVIALLLANLLGVWQFVTFFVVAGLIIVSATASARVE